MNRLYTAREIAQDTQRSLLLLIILIVLSALSPLASLAPILQILLLIVAFAVANGIGQAVWHMVHPVDESHYMRQFVQRSIALSVGLALLALLVLMPMGALFGAGFDALIWMGWAGMFAFLTSLRLADHYEQQCSLKRKRKERVTGRQVDLSRLSSDYAATSAHDLYLLDEQATKDNSNHAHG